MPRVDTALKIAKVLEVPLEYLINEKDLEIRPAAESLSKEEKKQTDQNNSSSLHQTENQYIEFYRRNRKMINALGDLFKAAVGLRRYAQFNKRRDALFFGFFPVMFRDVTVESVTIL